MKVNEIQIGDWVEWMGNKCKVDLPLLITEYQDNIDSNNVKPIPLTTEILEKNGFEIKCFVARIWNEYLIEYDYENVLYIHNNESQLHKKCSYVHELQRALRLCDLWDLASNFKV